MIKIIAEIIDTPSASPATPFAIQPQMHDKIAEAITTHQSLSLAVSLMDSQSEALCGKGLIFFPNL